MGKELELRKTFSSYMASEAAQMKLRQIISDKTNAARFTTAIISTVVNNPALAECDFNTIFSAALESESMKLSLSPKLGQSYLVPFNDNKCGRKVATFQIGYKGYIQLAMRSGQYRDIDAFEIRDGEYKGKDRETGKAIIEFIQDDGEREEKKIVGYFAYFELLNGFKKSVFWTLEKMEKHALTFSKGYAAKKGYTFWERDFNSMAFKTLLRNIISKWGVMSIEMQNAFEKDMAIISDAGVYYFDNDEEIEKIGKPKVAVPKSLSEKKDAPEKAAPKEEQKTEEKAAEPAEPTPTHEKRITELKPSSALNVAPNETIPCVRGVVINAELFTKKDGTKGTMVLVGDTTSSKPLVIRMNGDKVAEFSLENEYKFFTVKVFPTADTPTGKIFACVGSFEIVIEME